MELVDAAFGVDELILACVEWVRIGGDTDGEYIVFYSVDDFLFVRLGGGACDEALAGGDVVIDDRVIIRVDVFFHGSER